MLLCWSAILLGVPIYVFQSGLPQPADMALAVFCSLTAAAGFSRLNDAARASTSRLASYLGWVACVNALWFLVESFNTGFLLSTTFAAFNTVVFVGFLSFAERSPETVLRWTGTVTALSLVGQGALAVLRPDLNNGARLTLYFNNPNQLAYYCLGASTVVLVINAALSKKLPRMLVVASSLASGFVIYSTYSRSALGGFAMLCMVPFVRRPALVIAAAIPLAIAGAMADNPIAEDPLWQRRVEQAEAQQLSDYIEDRGIDRIVSNPEYLMLGSGEGAHERFHPFGLELHSSFAGVLFYYGLVGLALFAWFVFSLVRRLPITYLAYLAPTAIYSLFHNGLRFRVFWLLLAVVAVVHGMERASREASAPTPAPKPRRRRDRPAPQPAS
ncbi:MAG: hypothetical protein VYE22_11690 [Myxococcota bacterium]|nr:hypothetical protein [Myxococcota bacterium]